MASAGFSLLDTLKSYNPLFFGAAGFGENRMVNGVETQIIEDITARQSYAQEQQLDRPSRQYRRFIVQEGEWLEKQGGRLPTNGDNVMIDSQYFFIDSAIEEDGLWFLTMAATRQG